jgi:hypothetical protein
LKNSSSGLEIDHLRVILKQFRYLLTILASERLRQRRQRDFTKHLNIYYAAVIAGIREAESILIFGPGEAKGELKEQLEKNHLGGQIVDIETVDKMTNPQIAAKVRQYFAKEHLPTTPMS